MKLYFSNLGKGFLEFLLALFGKKWRKNAGYWLNVALAFDCWMNALWGGDPHETISSRLGRYAKETPDDGDFWARVGLGICQIMVGALNILQWNHCLRAIQPDSCHKNEVLE